jgi:hypothetical protein
MFLDIFDSWRVLILMKMAKLKSDFGKTFSLLVNIINVHSRKTFLF